MENSALNLESVHVTRGTTPSPPPPIGSVCHMGCVYLKHDEGSDELILALLVADAVPHAVPLQHLRDELHHLLPLEHGVCLPGPLDVGRQDPSVFLPTVGIRIHVPS